MISKTAEFRDLKKNSFKNSKRAQLQKLSTNIMYHSRNSREHRLGSQQLRNSYKQKRPNYSHVVAKSTSKLKTHNSQQIHFFKQLTKRSYTKSKGIYSPKKRGELQTESANKIKIEETTEQIEKDEKKKQKNKKIPLLQSYGEIREPDYKSYLLESKREWERCQIDKLFKRKIKNYINFINLINFSNRIIYEKRKKRFYTVLVGKGNNSALVKQIFKNRFWWTVIDDKNQQDYVNIVWTQTKKQEFIQKIKKPQNDSDQDSGREFEEQQHSVQKQLNKKNRHKSFFKNSEVINDHLLLLNPKDLRIVIENEYYTKSTIKWKALREEFHHRKRKSIEFTHNHLQYNWELGNKKRLFVNLKEFLESQHINPFEIIPLTFHISDITSQQFNKFEAFYLQKEKERKESKNKSKNIWIIKPGENTNRGTGIQVFQKLSEIKNYIEQTSSKFNQRTFILQTYISPFLFFKRKFDIRCYLLITSCGHYKAYFYKDGYIRTSSKQFSFKKLNNKLIHLTNDAIQKKSEQYGKFEKGNKISFVQFQKYIDLMYPEQDHNFNRDIFPKMIEYTKYAVAATFKKIDPRRREFGFQVFGLDFMIDQNFKPWLIQINTNPCLQLSSPLLASIIPSMLENTFRIAIDPIFPPPEPHQWQNAFKLSCPQNFVQNNRFELIFDSKFNQYWMDKQQQKNTQNLMKKENLDEISYNSYQSGLQ